MRINLGGFPLTVKNITNLQKKIQKVISLMPVLQKRFIEESVDYMYDVACTNIITSTGNGKYVPTGELLAGMKKDKELGKVFNDCAHAMWVEYGTGIVGQQDPHPLSNVKGYQYDVNEHGEKGWVYYKDGLHWTQGLKPHMFMYNTLLQYQANAKQIFSDCFKEVMRDI